jgi:hypothetical protein
MKRERVGNVILLYEESEAASAQLVLQATQETELLLRTRWSLELPGNVHLLVMTSWSQFMFNAAPWPWRVALALTLPLWARRVQAMWKVAGGWTNRFGRRVAIGVKPPALLEQSDRRIGERIFVQEDDLEVKVRQITCHELTHAATSALKLPLWLNEGLAARSVDHFSGHSTVRIETLQSLRDPDRKPQPLSYRQLKTQDRDRVVYQFARGYWLTRWLDESYPDILARLISTRMATAELERILAEGLSLGMPDLWPSIDAALLKRFAISDSSGDDPVPADVFG